MDHLNEHEIDTHLSQGLFPVGKLEPPVGWKTWWFPAIRFLVI